VNWYLKIILSQKEQGVTNYLSSIGVSPENIQYIISQEPERRKFLVGQIRKNPQMTLQELQLVDIPQKVDPYLKIEIAAVLPMPNILQQWALIGFRKIRKEKELAYLSDEDKQNWVLFRNKLREIRDWYANTNPDIASFSPEQAIAASDEWHQVIAGKGSGKIYEPTKPELIKYGPEWKNPEWQGWTVQQIMKKNDLLVEGNKMNNCVGGDNYCRDVEKEYQYIYSLRDPKNRPHVTISISPGGEIDQIEGNSGKEPAKKYKNMIKEWVMNNTLPYDLHMDTDYLGEDINSYSDTAEWEEAIDNIGTLNDYGFPYEFDQGPEGVSERLIEEQEKTRDPSYSQLRGLPETIINKLIEIARNKQNYLFSEGNEKGWESLVSYEDYLQKLSEEADDIMMQNFDYIDDLGIEYPEEENYETIDEYNEALEEYQKKEDEYRDEYFQEIIRGGWASNGFKHLQKLRETGEIPPHAVMHQIALEKRISGTWYKNLK